MTDTSSDGSEHSLQQDLPDEPFPTEALQPPDGSQSKTDRVWKLMLATMRILGKYCTQLITAAERALTNSAISIKNVPSKDIISLGWGLESWINYLPL